MLHIAYDMEKFVCFLSVTCLHINAHIYCISIFLLSIGFSDNFKVYEQLLIKLQCFSSVAVGYDLWHRKVKMRCKMVKWELQRRQEAQVGMKGSQVFWSDQDERGWNWTYNGGRTPNRTALPLLSITWMGVVQRILETKLTRREGGDHLVVCLAIWTDKVVVLSWRGQQ